MSWARPPARRRKTLLTTTATGQWRLSPHVLDAAASARMLSVMILLAIIAAGVEMATSVNFYIYNPTVTDAQGKGQRVPAKDIIAASQIETLHVFWLEPEQTASALVARMPELRAAFIWCGLPATCTIQVLERQPAFEWRQGQVRTWVDVEGVAFGARGQVRELPIVDVPAGVPVLLPGQQATHDLVNTMLTLATVLPEVKQYRFTPERGVEFTDPKGNWPVYVGLGSDVAARVTMWRALAASLAARNIRPKFVDVRYANAPFYSK